MACTFKTGLMTDKELNRSVRLVGAESFEALAANGDCVIGCIPHAGNWEILARIRPLFPRVKRFGSMYRNNTNIKYTEYAAENLVSKCTQFLSEGCFLGMLGTHEKTFSLWS